jgi:hypothetical protein
VDCWARSGKAGPPTNQANATMPRRTEERVEDGMYL